MTLDSLQAGRDPNPRTDGPSKRAIVLVGKGVCYDTGGINLKSANSMKTMKHDMAGSAAALATFIALTQQKDLGKQLLIALF